MAEICHHRKYRRFLLSCCYFEFSYYHRLNQLNCLDVSKVRSFAVALYCSKILLKSRFPLYPPPPHVSELHILPVAHMQICRSVASLQNHLLVQWFSGKRRDEIYIHSAVFHLYILPSVSFSSLEQTRVPFSLFQWN